MSQKFLSGLWSETAMSSPSAMRFTGGWGEVAQVQQKEAIVSGNWTEVAQTQQKEFLLSSQWVEIVLLTGVPAEEEPAPEIPLIRRRKLVLGMSAIPEFVPDPVVAPPEAGPIALSGEAISTTAVQLVFTNATNALTHQYRVNGGSPVAMPADKVVRNLASNTTFNIEVRGLNNLGPGPWSNVLVAKTWQEIDPNDVDGDGIPNINDPDHPDYDPNHPDSDPDGDGLKNKDDPDDNNDGILDINDPNHPDYDPDHPDSPDYQVPPEPLVATKSHSNMDGWVGSMHPSEGSKTVTTQQTLSYGASAGTPPYSYAWTYGPANLTNLNMGTTRVGTRNAVPNNQNGGTTKFSCLVDFGEIHEQDVTCTITDSKGQTTSFTVRVTLTHGDLR
jgi:hypothetical protein